MAKLKYLVTIATATEANKVIASTCSLPLAAAVANWAVQQDGVQQVDVFTDYARKALRVCQCSTRLVDGSPFTVNHTTEAQEYGG